MSEDPDDPSRLPDTPRRGKVLVVEDDDAVRRTIVRFLARWGHDVVEATRVAGASRATQTESIDLAIVDYRLPDGSAFDFLEQTAESDVATIVLTGQGTIDLAVSVMKKGAEHFLTKPVDFDSLETLIDKVLSRRQADRKLAAELAATKRSKPDPFLGTSRGIAEVRNLASTIAGANAPVLILGETGTGKGVLARWLHEHSGRHNEPFVDLNCAGLSKELVESDLFGHQKGAFTGATTNKRGLLEVANRGALFLDEIGDLDLSVQPKLLKVLEDKTFRRVGDLVSRPVDIRLIAATHRDLETMATDRQFRQDLLFRINTVTFYLPPLRERLEDLPPLADRILSDLCANSGRSPARLDESALDRLCQHSWPGNLRELRNVLERALLFNDRRGVVSAQHVHLGSGMAQPPTATDVLSIAQAEREAIVRALAHVDGRVDDAAKVLGVPRSSLYSKIKRHGIFRA